MYQNWSDAPKVRQFVDYLAEALKVVTPWEREPTALPVGLICAIAEILADFFSLAQPEPTEEGELGPWLQAVHYSFQSNGLNVFREAKSANTCCKRIVLGAKTSRGELLQLQRFLMDLHEVLEATLSTTIGDLTDKDATTENSDEQTIADFVSQLSSVKHVEDLENIWEESDRLTEEQTIGSVDEQAQALTDGIERLMTEKPLSEAAMAIIYIDELSINTRRYTAFCLAPFHPYPFGAGFDEEGMPSESSSEMSEIREAVRELDGIALIGEARGSLILVRNPEQQWEDLDLEVCRAIADHLPCNVVIRYESEDIQEYDLGDDGQLETGV